MSWWRKFLAIDLSAGLMGLNLACGAALGLIGDYLGGPILGLLLLVAGMAALLPLTRQSLEMSRSLW